MQFHKPDRPAPYLNARDQRRLLLMVAMLAVVIIGIQMAAQPSTWYWLTGPPAAEPGAEANDPPAEPVDARLPAEEDTVPPGGFRLVAAAPPDENTQETDDAPTAIEPEVYANVRDNSLGIRSNERGAYFKTLARARELTDAQRQTANSEVTFAQMFTDPEDYRGRLVAIRGNIKRLTPIKAGDNDFGIDTIYEAWLLTADSGDNPLVAHVTEIPAGMPTGDGLDLPCRLTGYFFKKYAYAAGHGPHSTTMLLGRGLDWKPPTPITPVGWGLAPYVLAVVVAGGLLLAVVLWRYSASDRRFRRTHLDRILQSSHNLPGQGTGAVPDADDANRSDN